jgi:hypothetical protein
LAALTDRLEEAPEKIVGMIGIDLVVQVFRQSPPESGHFTAKHRHALARHASG